MIEQIRARIERLNEVGQAAFNGGDFSFGFNTWKAGTIALLRRLRPIDDHIIDQIHNIAIRRIYHHINDALAYNVEACKNEAREILQILIETLPDEQNVAENNQNPDFWSLMHPRVVQLAKPPFDIGLYADSISACLREINTIVKNNVRIAINQELDGAPLMTRAFSIHNPIIQFDDLATENGRNIQLGYMKIFEGAMIGIRNPKAHANLHPDQNKTIHLLFLASFMFIKLQETGIIAEE